MTRRVRLLLLLIVVALLFGITRCERPRTPDWNEPVRVSVHPHAVDSRVDTARALERLDQGRLNAISAFFATESGRHNPRIDQPFVIELGAPLNEAPDVPPENGGILARLRWGLSLRWWRWRFAGPAFNPDIVVIARFSGGHPEGQALHSIGSASLRLVITNLPSAAEHADYGLVVLAHEILHTVGANDLYDPATGLPLFPSGYAEPNRQPPYPQVQAELMAGRIPVAPGRAVQASHLEQVRIGARTAREIGWLDRRDPSMLRTD